MADFYLGCDEGLFEVVRTLAGPTIRCTGEIVNVSEAELVESLSGASLSQWLALAFETPVTEDIQQAFMVGFGLPVIVYLSAWALGYVLNFASKD